MSKEPMLPSSTKSQILRIASALVGSVSLDTVRTYSLASFDNSQGDSGVRRDLNQLHKHRQNPFQSEERTLSRTITEQNFLNPDKKKSILGTLLDTPGHQYVNRL